MSELINYLVQNDENFRRARLPALYSDFRSQRTLNPDGFAANVAAWKRGLASALLAGHLPSSNASAARNHLTLDLDGSGAGDALLRALESKQFGRPLALGTVLQDALAAGELLPLAPFLAARQSIYARSWAGLPWAVLAWGLRQVGIGGGGGDAMPRGRFVVLANVEAAAKAFADAAAERTSPFERTFSKAHFRRTFEGSFGLGAGEKNTHRLSEADLDVLVTFLSRDKGVLVTDGHTVRIRGGAANEPPTITEEDAAIASLKELMEDLEAQTAALGRRIDELAAAAADAVRRKNRVSALAALKSKKLAEANLARRHATLGQLEDVAARIQQAADAVQLVAVVQSSTAALRSLNARVGGADKVEEVFESLREQMGEVDEVGNVIAEAGPAVDESEVDDEFEALLAEEREKEEAPRRAEREAQQARDAEATRQRLAQLENLGPVPAHVREGEGKSRPLTPVTATANELGGMHLDTNNEKNAEKAKEKPAQIVA
ncbi:Snf7-domain-containing protein [Whalleya microplaca]|nr:Snf7-domain-containing protein [Whalleya microplaca]